MVCRQLLRITNVLFTGLDLDEDKHNGFGDSHAVAKPLPALPSLTKLRFSGRLTTLSEVLAVPGYAPQLRELDAQLKMGKDAASEAVDDFCAILKSATRVTCLKWSGILAGMVDTLLPLVVDTLRLPVALSLCAWR